ncbi:hypothetical protein IB286_08340 [Spongiibacter sp. KMU-158]|uniref:Flagellar motor switch protein FliM n=1 Tax=Spongiibacter pelagi TaxID=2760804 RepID=A0A927C0I7_9GAMM|nr:hypothetical protein [Spongiibacter pelagi]MBD2859018.1 hypothetical protein [Spongiibacter pelagi]
MDRGSKDILSQLEVDALLAAIQQENPLPQQTSDRANHFDLATDQLPPQQRFAGLEQWNRRFAEIFRDSLAQSLNQEIDLTPLDTQYLPCSEYLHSLYVPTSIHMMRLKPLPGSALFALDAQLVFRLVESFFGSGMAISQPVSRQFSLTERRIVGRVVSMAHDDLEASAKHISELKCEPLGSEMNPSLVSVAAPSEVMAVSRFFVDIAGSGGEMHLVLPVRMLDELRDALAQSGGGQYRGEDSRWSDALTAAVLDVSVPSRYLLDEKTLPLGFVANLQVGDILPLTGRGAAITVRGRKITPLQLDVVPGPDDVKGLQLTIASPN